MCFHLPVQISQAKTWILHSLLTQLNGFEHNKILNFSKILKKFAIVFKFFEFFFALLILTNITGQQNF